jgi:hypothetical protein
MWTSTDLALIAFIKSDLKTARELTTEVKKIASQISYNSYGYKESFGLFASISVLEGDYPKGKKFIVEWLSAEPGIQEALKAKIAFCRPAMIFMVLPSISYLFSAERKNQQAAQVLALALYHPSCPSVLLDKWPGIKQLINGLRTSLGREGYEEALLRGQLLDLEKKLMEIKCGFEEDLVD